MRNDFREFQYYLISDRRYYEPMDYYQYRQADFLAAADGVRKAGWNMSRKGVWLGCSPGGKTLPVQGWKIHLSARPQDAAEVLARTSALLIARGAAFKFLLDKHILTLANSKSWPRGAAGKFMTVYPADEAEFKALLEELSAATSEFSGPYILSDRRYGESKVVFYRYGGIRLNARLEVGGDKTPVLVSPSGEKLPDIRTPYFSLPPWIEDPFPEKKEPGGGLNKGRYTVQRSLGFSNSGGVYLGLDSSTGRKIVIKEARPWVNETSPGQDMIKLLEKESRLLEKLKKHRISPEPVDFFREWEHSFLVQEYLDGYIPLSTWAMRNTVVLRTRFSNDDAKKFFASYAGIFSRLASLLEKVHGEGVIFGDFSANNVMVHPDSLDVKIIDLEAARDSEEPGPPVFITPGFTDKGRASGKHLAFEDDYYAFGANMLYALVRVGHFSELKPEIGSLWLDYLISEAGFPAGLKKAVDSLMLPDPAKRKKPAEVAEEFLKSVSSMPSGSEAVPTRAANFEPGRYKDLLTQLSVHLSCAADYKRSDRLWPASPDVFSTNPLSVSHGASGILKAVHACAPEKITSEMTDWVLRKEITPGDYPPGLYSGISGVAWVLLDLGLKREAGKIFEAAASHPLLHASPDMFNGLAGWGMTNLRFWLDSRENKYLERATAAGRKLLASSHKDGEDIYWKPLSGEKRPVGFAFGASGISVFLAYLSLASGDAEFEKAANSALASDLSKAYPTPEGGLSWPRDTSAGSPLLPYLEAGSSGVGMACLRLWKMSGGRRYSGMLEKIYIDCDRIYSAFPGRNNGMAGMGEFLLDAYKFTKDPKYKHAAGKLASGIEKFAVSTGNGTAFPGDGLFRLSCDYSTGSAGVMSFLNRLETGAGADFMLDELL